MSKEHFPVNDKSIADVNKANARAYSADAEDSTPEQRTARKNNETTKFPQTVPGIPKGEMKEKRHEYAQHLAKSRSTLSKERRADDHVRESSQEKGEDAWPASAQKSSTSKPGIEGPLTKAQTSFAEKTTKGTSNAASEVAKRQIAINLHPQNK